MPDVLIFALGYFLGSFVRSLRSPNLDKPDKILKWDSGSFGWRPVPDGSTLKKDETVLFAFEMKKSGEAKE